LTRELIEGLAGLESLKLSSNPIEGLDAELYAGGDGRKVLQSLRDYFASLNRGAVRHDQAKLLLVGNGRVGKTSLVARLLDDSFDPAQPSTHAIQLRVWPLHHVADDKLHGRPLRVNVWDFGGQDIYHATHRLFMRTRALFLLVWDRQTEHQQYSLDESGERYENFSLAYWLDYVHALSGSPVLVVQNKVDSLADKDPAYGTELLAAYPPPGGIVDFLHVSARRDADPGMAVLVARIRESLASMSAVGHFLPAQWVAVRDRLAGLGRHTLARADFDALCVEAGLQGSQPESLVRFLHESGALFYQPGQFGELLILDQRWAIDAVYALLDRRGAAYRSLRAAGRNGLTLDLLRNQVWRHVAADEHALLLDFMARCELCFELGQGRWYVPQLLPDEMPSRVARRWAEAPPHALQIRYRFLHRAIVDRFLVRAGRLGADDEPEIWRNGIVVLDASGDAEALVAADAAGGCIVARGRGPGGVALLCAVKREFDQLHQPFEARCFVSADQGQDWVDLAMLERHARAGLGAVLSEALRPVPVASLADFVGGAAAASGGLRAGLFSVSAKSAITARRDPARPEIFVSYAWGDADETGESREAIVDRLHDRLVAIGYRVGRDKKDAGYRSNISEFMQRIGHGELVVAVISYKYLRSPYCMYELLEIYRQGRFSERVFPIVLDDARIHTMDEMLDCFRFWQDEKQRIEAKIDAIGWRNLSVDGFFKDYERYYRTVFNHLDLLLTLIKDWNALTPKRLEENSFERLIGAIQAQMAQPG
jgi:internalin A